MDPHPRPLIGLRDYWGKKDDMKLDGGLRRNEGGMDDRSVQNTLYISMKFIMNK